MKFRSSIALRWLLAGGALSGVIIIGVACDNGSSAGSGGGGNTAGATPSAGASNSAGAPSATGGAGASSTGGAASGAAGMTSGSAGAAGCAGALICEDFESYSDKPAGPWKVESNAGTTVGIDTTKHVSGSQSVKFTTDGVNSYQRAFIGLTGAPFPIAGNAFYGRMMMYVTQAANDGVHWTMIQADGPVAAQGITTANVRYGGQQMKQLMANYDSSGKKSDCWQHSATKMPEGKWACMQWYFDGKTNTQKFWLDSVAIADLTVTGAGQGCIAHETNDTWYFPQDFTKSYVGWESYQKDDARQVWIDDFALDTSPIACPAPAP